MKKVCDHWETKLADVESGGHLFAEFETRAKNAAAEIFRVATVAEAKDVVANLAKYINAKKIVVAESPLQQAAGIVDGLKSAGIQVYTQPTEIAAHAESADMGISTVEFGIAETGSVCQDALAIESRLVSTLPPMHVAFIHTNRMVLGVTEAMAVISKVYDRGYISFITGPSRTADIERVLTIGVHGPSRFVIIAVDEEIPGGEGLMEGNDRNIKNEIQEKLNDEVLRGALGRFAEAYPIARAKAYENVADLEALRDELRQMKVGAVAHIDELANQFEAAATKRGAKVFRAKDGAALKKYLIDLCREKGVQRIVKSKSMASEEIHLNHDLEAAGLHVKETDLGEWIISLAGHKPSHMVMPAIHLSRHQIAEYFSKELKQEIPTDIPFMVQVARTNLRTEFLQADMGISGANFGIAENGAIGLVTNEGNARLVTTLPKIHVVIIGYEKLIPTIKDAAPILRTLPRNATGQLMTSYMSMVSGVTPTMVKKDGKWVEEDKELHIILFDNGRLNAARDEKFRQIYQCVRCASCLNVCPVYTLVGGHVYGHIYAGGIGAILTAFLNSMGDFDKINELCIGCRKCVEVCPGKIDIPGLIEELRARVVKEHGLPFAVRTVFENVISKRKVFHSLLRMASIGQKPFQTGRLIRHLPLFMAGMAKDRSLPAIADEPLRDRIPRITKKITMPAKRVAFFSGCNIDFVFPETGESVYKVLQDLNMEMVYPLEQSCCGKPVLGMGDRETGKKIAKENIIAFEAASADVIVAACPTCAETWHETYVELFADEPQWKARAEKIAHKFREFTSFVAEEYRKTGRLTKIDGPVKVTYHDSCHIKRGLGIYKEPRELLDAAPGYQLTEMKDCDKCCGMAGSFGIKYTELSMPILKHKITNIKDSGAEMVAVACPACMMQIQGGLDKQAPQIKIKHVADILAEKLK